jgi:hypothetical protein
MRTGNLGGNDDLQSITARCRAPQDGDSPKPELPLLIVAGVLRDGDRSSGVASIEQESRLVQIDIDLGELGRARKTAEEVLRALRSDPFVAIAFTSPSGAVKALMLVDHFESHEQAFQSARRYVSERHGVWADSCAAKLLQGTFVPYDPDVYVNDGVFPLPWTEWKSFGAVRAETGLEPWTVAQRGEGPYMVKELLQPFWAHYLAADQPLVFHQGEKQFYRYNRREGVWAVVGKQILGQRLLELLCAADRGLSGNEPMYPDGTKAPHKVTGLQKKINNRFNGEVLALLASVVADADPFRGSAGAGEYRVVFQDRTVTITTGGSGARWFAEPHRACNGETSGLAVPLVEDAKCDRFRKDLLPQLGEDDRRLLELFMGQLILQRNVTQTMLIVEGPGNDGKSTAANILKKLVGNGNHANLRTKHLGKQFEIGRMAAATLLIGRDVPQNFLAEENADVIKGLVGGDWLQGELKHGNAMLDVQGKFNLLVTTNERQRLKLGGGDVEAWRRRLLYIRLEAVRRGASIPDFDEMLWRSEGEGIARLALERALHLLSVGGGGRKAFALTSAQLELADELVHGSDTLRNFVKERLEAREGCRVEKSKLIEAYEDWCFNNDYLPEQRYGLQGRVEALTRELFGIGWSNNPKYGGRALVNIYLTRP